MQGWDVDPGNLMPEYTLWNITIYCFLWIKIPRITWMALQILCGYWRHTLYLFIFLVAIALLTFSACEAVWVGGEWVQSGEKCLLWIVCCYTLWSPSCVSVPDNGASWLTGSEGWQGLKNRLSLWNLEQIEIERLSHLLKMPLWVPVMPCPVRARNAFKKKQLCFNSDT